MEAAPPQPSKPDSVFMDHRDKPDDDDHGK